VCVKKKKTSLHDILAQVHYMW